MGGGPREAVTGVVIHDVQSRGAFRSVDGFDGRRDSGFHLTGSIGHLEEVNQGADVWIEFALSAL